jgi:hypothetical protein
MRRIASTAFTFGAIAAMLGCTNLENGSDTYRSKLVPGAGGSSGSGGTTSQGGSAGNVPDPRWVCLDSPPAATPMPKAPTVAYIAPIVDYANPPNALTTMTAAIAGLNVLVCSTTDYQCLHPISSAGLDGGPMLVVADPMRPFIYKIDLPFNADVFLRVNGPDYLQLEYYFGGPIIGNQKGDPQIVGDAIPPLTISAVNDFLSRGGKPSPHDIKKGILAARTVDCNAQRAEGITVRRTGSDPGSFAYTLQANVPLFEDNYPTDGRGVAGWANLEPGTFNVEGVLSDGRSYGNVLVQIRANQITLIDIRPVAIVPQ